MSQRGSPVQGISHRTLLHKQQKHESGLNLGAVSPLLHRGLLAMPYAFSLAFAPSGRRSEKSTIVESGYRAAVGLRA